MTFAKLEYDLNGNILAVNSADGRSASFEYDALGNITAITYPDGTQDTYAYDALGRVISEQLQDGTETEYTYDSLGNVVTVTENGETTTYTYDALSQPVSVTYPDGSVEYSEYDALGNIIKQTDADGNTTTYGYTVENMVSRVTYADGSSLHYAYDKAGNLIRETNADGGITRYEYDLLGQVTNVLSADGTTTEYEYNADGEVISELVRNIAYSGETEGHYSNLANTSSKPLVATAIRYTEDAVNANKGSGFAKPVPKTPTPAKPKVTPQEYAKARKQATTPTQAEYVQLRKSGVNMSYGQYVNQKQQTRFPSYGQYAYDKQMGKTTYQTYGSLQSATGQINHVYDKTPNIAAEATPKVESIVTGQKYSCSNFEYYAEKYFSDSNIYGTIVGGASIFSEALFKGLIKSVKNAVRPANIGAGTFAKQIANELKTLAPKFSTALRILSIGSIAIDVGMGIYNNMQRGESPEHIVADAFIDAVFTGGNILVSTAIGGFFGGPIGAGIAFVSSIAISYYIDLKEHNGATYRDQAKEKARKIIDSFLD